MFDGPQCQQTKRSFGNHGYAWFPPIMPCFQSHISLEFLAEAADGLLLYDGPLSSAHPGEPEDFIAVGKFTRCALLLLKLLVLVLVGVASDTGGGTERTGPRLGTSMSESEQHWFPVGSTPSANGLACARKQKRFHGNVI